MQAYADASLVTDDVVAAHTAPARLPNAKHLTLAFVAGVLALPLASEEVRAVGPHVVWGRGQRFVEDGEAGRWRRSGSAVTEVASGLPHAEEPASVVAAVEAVAAAGRPRP